MRFEPAPSSVRPATAADGLVAAGFLERDGEDYRFRHPLLRDAVLSELPVERRRALHNELATALATRETDVAERVAAHLRRADCPDAALAVLEQGAEAAEGRGDLGRCATLYLMAFRLACEHAALGARRGALQRLAIEYLYRARRWTELDPLIRDAWSRRDRLSVDDRAALALAMAWQLFARGQVTESWAVIQQELAYRHDAGAGDRFPDLHGQAAYIAWLRGDPQDARLHADRSLESAHRLGDTRAAWWAQHFRIHADYRLTGDRRVVVEALRENVAAAGELRITDGEALAWWDLAAVTAHREDVAMGQAVAERAGALSTLGRA